MDTHPPAHLAQQRLVAEQAHVEAQGKTGAVDRSITDPRSKVGPDPLLMYGTATCEDTAVTRSRLRALGVPYREVDIDLDPWARDQLYELAGGRVSTPTLVFGDRALIAVEPSPRELDEMLSAAGYAVEPPAAVEYHGSLASLRVPLRTVPRVGGGEFSLESISGELLPKTD